MVRNQRKNHPWAELSNEELLKSAGLYKKDFQTGKSGYTLAAVLLFGTEQLIQSVLPHHKTDAIQRIINIDRYDDRDDIRINLIDSYDRLMNFISKHLPDKFHLDGDQRISLRDNLFREIIGNLLTHREFTNGFPAKLIIEKNSVTTENWNKPHGSGNIDPNNFSPHPKNPMIAKFFKQIGWVDELGSGVRNTYKFCKLYTPNSTPEFIEGDIFKAIIPITSNTEQKGSGKSSGKSSVKSSVKILQLLSENKNITIPELSEKIGISTRAIEKQIAKLKELGTIKRVGSAREGYWELIEK